MSRKTCPCDHKIRMSGDVFPGIFLTAVVNFESENDIAFAFCLNNAKKKPPGWPVASGNGINFFRLTYFLLDCLQIFLFSASLIRLSRKSGWAMEISFSARYQVGQVFRDTAPYSVTMKLTI